MIGHIYRLVDTKRIEMKQREICLDSGNVVVRPTFMSICAADQRYYQGNRNRDILNKKLPMALIHEAIGVVLYDSTNQLEVGTQVVLVPLIEGEENKIKANYRKDSKFVSSDCDGFMRDVLAVPHNRLVETKNNTNLHVFCELLSVAINALSNLHFENVHEKTSFGVWGDGSMGFVTALAIKCFYPECEVYVFGKNARRLNKFSFVTNTFYIDNVPEDLVINNAFECVGGLKTEQALNQIIDIIEPQGTITLLGVSENNISINTRKVLEKGLNICGKSRSNRQDIEAAVELIDNNRMCRSYLKLLVSETIEVSTEKDIYNAFEKDILSDFKTIIKWNI